ncbi:MULTISPECIES: S8 family serine peptidase [Aurantimonas]|uniref:S8 family serine peptidase n=1 Tax=Aurantimonas TaxID=182269 RepID=UPI0035174570
MEFYPNSLSSKGFSWHAAASLVGASNLAYNSERALRRTWDSLDMRVVQVFSAGVAQGYVVENDQLLICAFRGTDSIADWLASLNIATGLVSFGSAHRGFYHAFRPVAPLVTGCAQRAKNKGQKFWLTGHSFGGALAQIGAQENWRLNDSMGLFTFGQPRTANVADNDVLTEVLGLDYHRVVNGIDYVPRVPANIGHSGRLVRVGHTREFAVEGNLETAPGGVLPDGVADRDALPPVPLDEFFEQQRQIKASKAELDAYYAGSLEASPLEVADPSAQELDAAVEFFLPGIRDHRITRYVAAILEHVPSESRKFDSAINILSSIADERLQASGPLGPNVRRATTSLRFDDDHQGALPADIQFFSTDTPVGFGVEKYQAVRKNPLRPFVIYVNKDNWIPPASVTVQSTIGRFRTVLAEQSAVSLLQNDGAVVDLVPSHDAGIAELDRSLGFVKADAVHRPPLEEKGDGALIGLIDSGIDILHEAFQDATGQTRIVAIWNQRDPTGPSPKFVDAAFEQSTGTLHLATDIQQMIDAASSGAAQPHWMMRDGKDGHGTHVAGIAAGRKLPNIGPGMAPEARLVVVIPNQIAAQGDPNSLGYTMSHLDAVAFFKRVARGNTKVLTDAKPMVVNISSGMNAGAHDGTTALERGMDEAVGQGFENGFVIVKSAGNERERAGHASLRLFQGGMKIEWDSADAARDSDYFQGWFSSQDRLKFRLVNPLGNDAPALRLGDGIVSHILDGNRCQLSLKDFVRENGEQRLTLVISPEAANIRPGTWTLFVEGEEIATTDGMFHLWVERANARPVTFKVPDTAVTISIPGTAQHVITVGACTTDVPVSPTGESSLGLTRNGMAKPDIIAPGGPTSSAQANGAPTDVGQRQGTSIAAPHVTGVIALAMSHRDKAGKAQLNTIQIKQMLLKTAVRLRPIHDPALGHGILNAEAFVSLAAQRP